MNIGIYLYQDAEVLDFAGPFEVFCTAKRLGAPHWNVFLIGQTSQALAARGGMLVTPHYTLSNHPELDLLIVPGGIHTQQMSNTVVSDWLVAQNQTVPHIAAVCTGVFILASAGLLTHQQVTTHWEDVQALQAQFPSLRVQTGYRWIHDDKFTTCGGISAGIDMSLALVARHASQQLAEQTAHQMEYLWHKNP